MPAQDPGPSGKGWRRRFNSVPGHHISKQLAESPVALPVRSQSALATGPRVGSVATMIVKNLAQIGFSSVRFQSTSLRRMACSIGSSSSATIGGAFSTSTSLGIRSPAVQQLRGAFLRHSKSNSVDCSSDLRHGCVDAYLRLKRNLGEAPNGEWRPLLLGKGSTIDIQGIHPK